VSLFAEMFNEMLLRDFGFHIYTALMACPDRSQEDTKQDNERKKGSDKRSDSKKREEKRSDKDSVDQSDKGSADMKKDNDKASNNDKRSNSEKASDTDRCTADKVSWLYSMRCIYTPVHSLSISFVLTV